MKKNFTRFLAALALLVFMAPSMVMWGQTRATVTDELTQSWTGVSGTNYSNWSGKTNNSDAVWAGNSAGGNNSIQLRSNNNNSGIITTTSGGTIKSVSVDWNSNTSNGRTLNVYGKNSAYSSPSNLYNDNDQGTLLGTIVKGTSTSLTISGSYEYIGMRSASGAMYLTKIYVEWETGGGGGSTDPTIFFDSQSANLGIKGVGEEFTTSFTVSQTNLTGDITLTLEGQGELGTTSIEQGADPTEVTWTYTPNEAININTTITATSEGAEPVTFTITGEAKAYHNVIIAPGMANGAITADPTQAYEGQYVTLTIVPATGYELEELTVVDGDDNEIEVDNLYRFQMPDSDVTVSATFVEAEPTIIITDVLNYEFTGISGSGYKNWSGKTGQSGAVYAGNSNAGATCIQLRTTNSNSGIITTTSGGKVSKVTVEWATGNTSGRSLDVYGKDSAYSTPSDLYNSSNQGTKLGSIVYGTDTELTISGNYSYIGLRSASGAIYLDEIDIDWAVSGTPAPSISAENVNIAYDAIEGSIAYTINNGVDGGILTAATESNWLTLGTVGETVPFTCSANEAGISRQGVITLTYTYGDNEVVNKDVTITQAGNPNYTPTIAEVRAQGTGSVVTKGVVTSIVGNTAYIQDATAAICVFGNSNYPVTANVGDEIRVSGTLSTYNGLLEITNPEYTVLSSGNTTEPELMTIAEVVASTNQGWYIRIEEATVTAINDKNVTIAQGENNVIVRFASTNDITFEVNDIISLNGNIGAFNGVQIANPQNVEVQVAPSVTVTPDVVNVDAEEHDGTLDLTYENLTITDMGDFAIQYYDVTGAELNGDDEPDWIAVEVAEQDPSEGEGYVVSYIIDENDGEARAAYFKVFVLEDENYVYSNLITVTQDAPEVPFTGATYTLATTIESGRHYIITNGSNKAMGAQGGNNRAAVEITTDGNVAQVDSDDVVELVINGPDGNGFYTIYDANVPGYLYAAGGTSSNHLKTQTFCDNKGQWTIGFDAETSAASIMANISGNNVRNTMRYNSNNDIFSCYSGGQQAVYLYLKDEETPQYDFYKDIAGYGQAENGNYYLIASPIDDADPVAAGMITDELGAQATPETSTYDFYLFDQTQDEEWQNYRQGTFKLASGMGYLYANKENKTIHFDGTPYDGDGSVTLVKDNNADWAGWNLVGNPFGQTAYIDRDFYAMNEDGSEIMTDASTGAVEAMQGIFVIAEEDGETLTFTTEAPTAAANVTLNLSQNCGAVIDRAIVRFNEGRQLPKFQLNAGSTKLYIPQGSKDYAVVRSANEGEMPVSFKAAENGTYTLNVEAKNVEVTYLHLIDNRTGADVDLLANPSYTFEANKGDNANRFRLVFKAGTSIEENASTNSFAYFNGSAWVISNTGDATLQVIDMMGRVLSSEQISGNTAVNINETAGIYMLRLVNGENVMVQKVVVR